VARSGYTFTVRLDGPRGPRRVERVTDLDCLGGTLCKVLEQLWKEGPDAVGCKAAAAAPASGCVRRGGRPGQTEVVKR